MAVIKAVSSKAGIGQALDYGLILAKNHMVTKQYGVKSGARPCLILAKNHMVTKPPIHVTIYLKIIKY